MKQIRNKIILLVSIFGLFGYFLFDDYHLLKQKEDDLSASIINKNSIETKDIVKKFTSDSSKKKVKVMIVAGHDDQNSGAYFNGFREADLNLKLAIELDNLMASEKIDTFLIRDEKGFNKKFLKFLETEEDEINDFVNRKKNIINNLIQRGDYESKSQVHHNSAKPEVAKILYGINKYANDNKFDIVIHVHFNDYPGRKGNGGLYNGFSIYVPEEQYSNAEASLDLANKIKDQLSLSFAQSNLPQEGAIVEDQELIAVGSYNTIDPVSILIEYGYIYEKHFTDKNIDDVIFKEMANQTYLGVLNYLNNREDVTKETFNSLSFYQNMGGNLKIGDSGLDVLFLQDFLRDNSFYPYNKSLNECPINGSFGKCTQDSLKQFQKKNSLEATGFLGEKTKEIINQQSIIVL